MATIDSILTPAQLKALRAGYEKDRAQMAQILSLGLPAAYGGSKGYGDAIFERVYADPPKVLPSALPKGKSWKEFVQDRERSLVAVLATKGGGAFPLAFHLYVGLMEGLSPAELADVLLLVGFYAGVDRFTEAAEALRAVEELLAKRVTAKDPLSPAGVIGALKAKFLAWQP